ncbi:ferritin-like domain-containing protein [Hypoxylon rubiginosum]|uniref:Ferritin-like domain-containing protein n=1 Tax=Hypoxylon rubiginosum TaxID=110542 RepID=A0ACC0CI11_9PEZI|nr:ferritin-like domain-containing protein [Hypoxylon rubiginosum]
MKSFAIASIYLSVTALAMPVCDSRTGENGVTLDLMPETITNLQLALFLENLEFAFFQSASANFTASDPALTDTLNQTIREATMQEATHQKALRNILDAADADQIEPCQYRFPSQNTSQFLALGRTLSSVGVGATVSLAGSIPAQDVELVSGIASIAATEARHSAFFETANGKLPNPAPFDTPVPSTWAFNLALGFVVPGSCPVTPPIPVLSPLVVEAAEEGDETTVDVSWDPVQTSIQVEGNKPLFVAWINQLASPIYTPLSRTSNSTGKATMPEGLEGPIVVALTAQDYLERLEEVAVSTVAGPAVLVS